jgi:hypothetical protein
MQKIILPSLLAAVVIFIWSSISWMMIGWHMIDIFNLPDESVVQQMDATISEPGIYVYPGYPVDQSEAGMEAWTNKHLAGPLLFMVYEPKGCEPMMAGQFVKGFVLNYITAFIAATLLFMTLAQNPSYWRRVTFVMLLGLFAGLMYPFSEWNWWRFPIGYTLVNVADGILTWFFAGMVLAWRIKP